MTVVDVADATETRQAVRAIADHPGPVYLRLKRGEIPQIFDGRHEFSLAEAQVVVSGRDVVLIGSGMMLAATLAAARTLRTHDIDAAVLNVPVIKPLDTQTLLSSCRRARAVITAENHTVIGGLGSAVAETLAEHGGPPLARVGIEDRFAESGSRAYLFSRYGLTVQRIVDEAWRMVGPAGSPPVAADISVDADGYAPV
jgi:transketolase